MTTLHFGGIDIDEEADDGFHLARLIGWDDAAPTRVTAEERPQGHGTFRPGPVYRGTRVVSVEGSWSGSSIEDAYRARRRMAALPAGESPFEVDDILGTTRMVGALAKAPQMDDQIYSPFFTFAFDVVSASDPFRYGDPVVETTGLPVAGSGIVWPLGTGGAWLNWGTTGDLGRVETPNDGTAETYSLLEVTGGMSLGFLLTWVPTGQLISFDREVPPGSTITIDPSKGSAVIDGQSDVSGYLTISDYWFVPPGETGSIQFAAKGVVTGTPTLTARTSPAIL
jgi:hypothetical protein